MIDSGSCGKDSQVKVNECVCDGCVYLSLTEKLIMEGPHTLILEGGNELDK